MSLRRYTSTSQDKWKEPIGIIVPVGSFERKDMSWTLSVWEKSLPVYEAILAQPFIKELADGSLSAERFSRYIAQDELYLGTYGRQMFQIAGLLADPSEREMFTAFAQSGIDGEKAMHQLL